MEPGIVQTVAILAAALVYLSKQLADTYKGLQRRNGKGQPGTDQMVKDLHEWHRPVTDPLTGQPKFMWYEESGVRLEMALLRETIHKLTTTLQKTDDDQ